MQDRLSSCSLNSGRWLQVGCDWKVFVWVVVGLDGDVSGSGVDYWGTVSALEGVRVEH